MNTVLIIDDDLRVQETLRALLDAAERRLEFVSDPDQGVARAVELQPDLILLDVLMPGGDGFSVCRRLRAHPLLAEVPILLLTVLEDRDSRLAGLAAGADDFLSKPFDRAELVMRVQTILRLNRYRRLLEERERVDQLTEYALAVSHELKAPLRGLRQLAEWIRRDHASRLDPEGARLLALLRERAEGLDRTVDGLLECARVGQTRDAERQVPTADLVREILDQLAFPSHCTVLLAEDLPTVRGNRERLHQVFQNLLDNAVTYLDKPSGKVEVSALRRSAAWEFRVADNGPGIPARFLERACDAFWRLRQSDGKKGAGLGLTLVKRIVENRGGTVWIESREGAGTAVHFTWPDEPGIRKPPRSGPGRPSK